MSKKHIYIGGSLFSEAEVSQRLKEGEILRKEFDGTHTVFNPIEAPCNDKSKLPTAEDIFIGDTNEIIKSDVFMADLSNEDAGLMFELGIAWGLQHAYRTLCETTPNLPTETWYELFEKGIKNRDVHAVLSDIRLGAAHNYEGRYIPMSFNQYVVGGIEDMGGTIHNSFEDAVKCLDR